MRRLTFLIVSVLVTVSGCTCVPDPCSSRSGVGAFPGGGGTSSPRLVLDPQGHLFLDQRRITVDLAATGSGNGCFTPTSVTSQVSDPSDTVIPSAASLLPTSGGERVTFDAGIPGWYHVETFVEPNLGEPQLDFLAVHDRTVGADRGTFVKGFPQKCDLLQRTLNGAFFCGAQCSFNGGVICSTSVLGHLDNAAMVPVPNPRLFAVVGNVVWGYDPDQNLLGRWVDVDGGNLEPSPAQPIVAGDGGFTLLDATDTDALLAGDGTIAQFGLVDGGLSGFAGGPGEPRLPVAVLRANGNAFVAYLPDSFALPDAGFQVCAFDFDGGLGDPAPPCQSLSGDFLGVSAGGFWSWDDAQSRLSHQIPQGARLVGGGSLPISDNSSLVNVQPSGGVQAPVIFFSPTFAASPSALSQGGLVPTDLEGNVILEAFDPLNGGQIQGATDQLVWEGDGDGGLIVFTR